jgi:hypothetical protein
MHQAFYGSELATHNSYVWALVSGGVGALGLYLLLFYLTYQMLKELEKSGPRELLWLTKGLRVGLVPFLVASAFADLWHSELAYLIIGLTVAVMNLSRQRAREAGPRHSELQNVPVLR